MEVFDFVKLGLQAIGTGIAVILFFKREMDNFKKELRENIDRNSERVQKIEREFLEYQKETLEKFVKKDDFDEIKLDLKELKALVIRGMGDDRKAT